MADNQQPPQQDEEEDKILAYFPDPPPFYKHFTPANLDRLAALEKDVLPADTTTATHASSLTPAQILALPTELRYLLPPTPPAADEEFKVFGQPTKAAGTAVFDKNMTFIAAKLDEWALPGWTYEQLYPASTEPSSSTLDRQNYLFRFLRSVLVSYIELLGIVAVDPVSEAKNEKLRDILTLVANMHALVNEYRPHQARETLIGMLERQVERKKGEIEGVRKMEERVRDVLGGFGELGKVDGEGVDEGSEKNMLGGARGRTEMQSGMWEALDEILG
ncbi:mediator of RNA polymerase II transcription subunit 7 [Dothidotthia symphoricarpi CBS 119687]|uniref:Mediator of RNA polymerase II transcription subunit 7 n=1 Tax=Dothidotthia symphoricarpi CBS 119687 TaxID=1392245 RepID=A0A6A5ZVW7_9PLEO|nr:mediator of RNA polymerase II transcription subunit 7 [Dothidotthia symphoricarpi CBS 119687]KAF2123882.1 mediator of RNA polymerase II transcription subunit 7 [Dothidotthia symphoricarpi CBS 119687]